MIDMSSSLLGGAGGLDPLVEGFSMMKRFRGLIERGSSIPSLRHASSQGREQMNPHTEGSGFDSRTIARASPCLPRAILPI
jgi:hypothetical protein